MSKVDSVKAEERENELSESKIKMPLRDIQKMSEESQSIDKDKLIPVVKQPHKPTESA